MRSLSMYSDVFNFYLYNFTSSSLKELGSK